MQLVEKVIYIKRSLWKRLIIRKVMRQFLFNAVLIWEQINRELVLSKGNKQWRQYGWEKFFKAEE